MTVLLLTGAGGSAAANALAALRAAGRGYRAVGVDASPLRLHLAASDERVVVPQSGTPGFVAALRQLAARHGVAVVLPQPDPDVRAVGAARDMLGAATCLPSQAALELAADKLALAARLQAAGVPVPDSGPAAPEPLAELLEWHATVWLRARRGAGSRASLPVTSVPQAQAWVAWWVAERGLAPDDFMAAEALPGREYAWQGVWQDGELVAGQARERLEHLWGHLTPSGRTSTPAVARTVREPQVDATAIAAVRALDPLPHGVYGVDLRADAAGTVKVTEINAGRFFTTANFFAAAGLNLPDLLVRCALGERPARLGSSPLPAGLHWIRMVDMGYRLVADDALDPWPRAGA